MISRIPIFAAAALLAPALKAADAEGDQLVVPARTILPGAINGVGSGIMVIPNGLSMPVLSPEVAERLSLSRSIFGVQARVGNAKLPGHTGVVRLKLGGVEQKRRVLWFTRPQRPSAAAVMGPGAVSQSVVTFTFAPSDATAHAFEFPLVRQNNRMGTLARVGSASLFIMWDLGRDRSLATAAAASALAASYAGVLVGKPRQEIIEFGLERPVQSVRLGDAFALGPLRMREFDARTTDYGSTTGIQNADGDANEIIVTAKGRKDRSLYTFTVGARDMQGCSRLEFDKRAAVIRLYCARAG